MKSERNGMAAPRAALPLDMAVVCYLLVGCLVTLGVPVIEGTKIKISDLLLVIFFVLTIPRVVWFMKLPAIPHVRVIVFPYSLMFAMGAIGFLASFVQGLVDDEWVVNYLIWEGKRTEYIVFLLVGTYAGYHVAEKQLSVFLFLLKANFWLLFVWVVYYYVEGSGPLVNPRVDFPFVSDGQNLGLAIGLLLPYILAHGRATGRVSMSSAIAILGGLAVLLSGGRAGFLAYVFGIVVFFSNSGGFSWKTKWPLLAVVVAIITSLVAVNVMDNLESGIRVFNTWNESSSNKRVENILLGWSIWEKSPLFPLLGAGTGSIALLDVYFWHLVVEYGIVGFSCFVAVLLSVMIVLSNNKKRISMPENKYAYYFASAGIASIASFMIAGILSESVTTDRVGMPFWFWLGISMGFVTRHARQARVVRGAS